MNTPETETPRTNRAFYNGYEYLWAECKSLERELTAAQEKYSAAYFDWRAELTAAETRIAALETMVKRKDDALSDSIRLIKDAISEGIPGASQSPHSFWVAECETLQAALALTEQAVGDEVERLKADIAESYKQFPCRMTKEAYLEDANTRAALRAQLAREEADVRRCEGIIDGMHTKFAALEEQLTTAETRITVLETMVKRKDEALREDIISAAIILAASKGKSYEITRDCGFIDNRCKAALALTEQAVGDEVEKMRADLSNALDQWNRLIGEQQKTGDALLNCRTQLATAQAELERLKEQLEPIQSIDSWAALCQERDQLRTRLTAADAMEQALVSANKDFALIARLVDGTQAANTAYQAYQSSNAALDAYCATKEGV